MAIKKIKLPGMTQPVDIGTTWTNVSDKPDLITSEEATAYMQKGVDYVTAGQKTGTTLGNKATAEGYSTTASGPASHAEGNYTTANHKSQHVFGEFNIADDSTATASSRGNYIEIVGKGTSDNARSNARTLDWNGNEVLAGKLTVGAAPTENMDVATKQYVDNILATNDAMIFKGTIGTNGTITTLPAIHEAGWTYKVITAGSFAGQTCEVGDMIVCIADGETATDGDWIVVQTNVDGAVIGPVSSTAGNIATFTGTTGKVIQDSGIQIDQLFRYKNIIDGSLQFSSSTYTPAAKQGDVYRVGTKGYINQQLFGANDIIICIADTDAGTSENVSSIKNNWTRIFVDIINDNLGQDNQPLICYKENNDNPIIALPGDGKFHTTYTVSNLKQWTANKIEEFTDVYWATYGSSTINEMQQAFQEKRMLFIYYNNKVYSYINSYDPSGIPTFITDGGSMLGGDTTYTRTKDTTINIKNIINFGCIEIDKDTNEAIYYQITCAGYTYDEENSQWVQANPPVWSNTSFNLNIANRADLTTTTGAVAYYSDTNGTFASDENFTWDSTNQTLTAYKLKGYVVAGQKSGTALGDKATAEGYKTTASGDYSHAEGQDTEATGNNSHAEGAYSQAGYYKKILSQVYGSDSIGTETQFRLGPVDNENDSYPFDKGHCNIEYNNQQYQGTYIKGYANESEIGFITVTISNENLNIPINDQVYVIIDGYNSHAEGYRTQAFGYASHAEGLQTNAYGYTSHAEGYGTQTFGNYSHAEGQSTTASGDSSHTEGDTTTASGDSSHAEGETTAASGLASHAEGYQTTASGIYSHAEGKKTKASDKSSHAEGNETIASYWYSHAEGNKTIASGLASHAEGETTAASGLASHAEGRAAIASGIYSHAEGAGDATPILSSTSISLIEGQIPYQYQLNKPLPASTENIYVKNEWYTVIAMDSKRKIITLDRALPEEESLKITHAGRQMVVSSGRGSHAEGAGTIANHKSQHVFGEYNIADNSTEAATDKGNYVEIVGNGNNITRSNARTLDWNGNEVLAGKLTVGANPTEDMDVVTKQYVDNTYNTVSGHIATISDGIATSVKETTVNITYRRQPWSVISGWSECNIYRIKHNLCSEATLIPDKAFSGTQQTYMDSTVSSILEIPIDGGKTYYFYYNFIGSLNSTNQRGIAFFDNSNSFVGKSVYSPASQNEISITAPIDAKKVAITVDQKTYGFALYEYIDTTITIPFPIEAGTVYSGTLTISQNGAVELKTRPIYENYNGETLIGPWVSNQDSYSADGTPTNGAFVIDLGGEETVYQFNIPQVPNINYGENNIWASCGDIEITYRVNTERELALSNAINQKIDAPIIPGTANQILALNDHLTPVWQDRDQIITISSSTPTINALPNIRYVCGEVTTLDITLPASGIVDIMFISGSVPTTLTITPSNGVTLKWANGFDPMLLDANTTYEINIMDGLGVVAQWT